MIVLLSKVWEVYKPFKWFFAAVIGMIFLGQLCVVVSPYFMGKIVDGMSAHLTLQQLFPFFLVIASIQLFERVILQTVRGIFELKYLDYAVVGRAVQYIVQKVFGLSIGQHLAENSGRRHSVIRRGEGALIQLSNTLMYQLLPLAAFLTLITVVLCITDWVMGLVVICGLVLYGTLVVRYTNQNMKGLRTIEKLQNDDDKLEHEFIGRAPLVLVNAQEQRVFRETEASWEKVEAFGIPFWTNFEIREGIRRLILVSVEITVFALGLYYYSRGIMSTGAVVACWSWSRMAVFQMTSLGNLQQKVIKEIASVTRLLEMINETPNVVDAENALKPVIKGEIVFEDVVYAHAPRTAKSKMDMDNPDEAGSAEPEVRQAVLKGVTFKIIAGQRVAVVGLSGAGKSTIVHALLRSEDPQSGRILIDGHDLRDLERHHYRQSVGLVEQSVQLFDKPLRYNLTFALNGEADSVTDEDLDRVCKMARVDQFFPRLELGYDTEIGERGVKLSGGECQRTGIARALLKDPPILIFDEATSSLDSVNESLINEAMEGSSKGRTTIIIAHRLSTVRNADKIIVVDDGRIAGEGKHAELMVSCEVYRKLVEHQTDPVSVDEKVF